MSCNKFPNKCARGIGIMSKNQPKFDLMPSHGFWSGRLNVASVKNRTAKKLLGSTQSIEKKVIFYYQDQADLTPILFPETPVTHVHVAAFHVYRPDGGDNEVMVHLNDDEPLLKDDSGQYVVPEKFQQLKTDIDEMHKVGIKVILMLGGAGGAYELLLDGGTDYSGGQSKLTSEEETALGSYFKNVVSSYGFDGIDFNIEDASTNCVWHSPNCQPDTTNVLVKLAKAMANGNNDFIVSITPLSILRNSRTILWYNKLIKELNDDHIPLTYWNVQMYAGAADTQYFSEMNLGDVANMMTSLKLDNNQAVLGMCFSPDCGNIMKTKKGFEDALEAFTNFQVQFGGMFSWEYAYTAPYQPGGGDDSLSLSPQLYWAFQVQSVL